MSVSMSFLQHRETLAFMSVLLQGKLHCAHVMVDGSMMSEGKVFQAPERWLEWIIGNNIPVGSGYALDKASHESSCSLLNASRPWLVIY